MSYIELSGITYAYGRQEPNVLENLSLTMERGRCLIVEGDNGSGKTTLFRLLNGLAFPQKGQYFFDGQKIDAAYMKDNKRAKGFHKRIGYLFQNPDIMLFNSSVYDEVAFGPRQMGFSDEKVDQRVRDCMRLFQIEALSDKAPYHLSGGQKKRVALASILSLNPELLILDEPFAGLDQKGKEWLLSFLKGWMEAGKTLIIATHDENLAQSIGDDRLEL